MSTKDILTILQIVLAVVLVVTILMQSRGSGLGNVFGMGGGESYRSKRGAEKLIYNVTIATAILFSINAIAIYYLNSIA